MPQVVALVPMRHVSERVPGKNYRPLGGRPLFHHIVTTLLGLPQISEVIIDTDSPLIAADAAREFPSVRVIARPDHLLGENVPMNDILLHDVEAVDADYYVQTHSTNPLLTASTITGALDAFLTGREEFDSLFTVTALHARLWTLDGKPINHDPTVLLRTQDLPPVMEENSCLYVFSADNLRRRRTRIGERPLLYEIPALEAWDIDDEDDWAIAAALYDTRRASAR